MEINHRMFAIAKEKGFSDAQLAKGIGVSATTLSAWKTRGTNPPADSIERICRYLEVPIEYLLEGKPNRIPSESNVSAITLFTNISEQIKKAPLEKEALWRKHGIDEEDYWSSVVSNLNIHYFINVLFSLSKALDVKIDEFFTITGDNAAVLVDPEETELIGLFRALSKRGRALVKAAAYKELEHNEVTDVLVKYGLIPADREMIQEERNALFAVAEAFFNRQK